MKEKLPLLRRPREHPRAPRAHPRREIVAWRAEVEGVDPELAHHRERARGSAGGRARRRVGPPVRHDLAEHADLRGGAGLSRRLSPRGDQPVRGARHHASVRAGGRALPRRRRAWRARPQRALGPRGLPGFVARPTTFFPMFQKHVKTTCGGVQIHVTDRAAFRPVATYVALVAPRPPAGTRGVSLPHRALRVHRGHSCFRSSDR